MMPIIFKFADFRVLAGKQLGVGPPILGIIQPPKYYVIGGITRDAALAPLGSCTVDLYLTSTKTLVDTTTSDVNGNYSFRSPAPATQYYAVSYKAGAPDIFATSLNTLTGV